jgi:hypothetical protein
LDVHPFATLITPLRLVEGKSPVFLEARGCFVTGDEKVLEESKEKAAGLVCNHGSG